MTGVRVFGKICVGYSSRVLRGDSNANSRRGRERGDSNAVQATPISYQLRARWQVGFDGGGIDSLASTIER